MQDKRDQIRIGLLPPDAPKGKHLFVIARQPTHHVPSIYSATGQSYKSSNVGCRPRPHPSRGSCETQRKQGHETMNAERKLTDEQRREKLEAKKANEERNDIYGLVDKYVLFLSFITEN